MSLRVLLYVLSWTPYTIAQGRTFYCAHCYYYPGICQHHNNQPRYRYQCRSSALRSSLTFLWGSETETRILESARKADCANKQA